MLMSYTGKTIFTALKLFSLLVLVVVGGCGSSNNSSSSVGIPWKVKSHAATDGLNRSFAIFYDDSDQIVQGFVLIGLSNVVSPHYEDGVLTYRILQDGLEDKSVAAVEGIILVHDYRLDEVPKKYHVNPQSLDLEFFDKFSDSIVGWEKLLLDSGASQISTE